MIKCSWILALVLLLFASSALAQDCLVGVYGDEAPSDDFLWLEREAGNPFFVLDVYYVVQTEGYVLGVAWYREKQWDFDIVASQVHWESYGTFLETSDEGWRIGLGTCHFGFGGQSVAIMKETMVIANAPFKTDAKSPYAVAAFQVIPNPIQNPDHVVVADCDGALRICEVADPLYIFFVVVSTEGDSFGKIKAMYR